MAKAKPSADLVYLCRALNAPAMAAAIGRLGRAGSDRDWSHEEFLAACLEREVASRRDHGGENRVRAARFRARKSFREFFDHQRSLNRDVVADRRERRESTSARVPQRWL